MNKQNNLEFLSGDPTYSASKWNIIQIFCSVETNVSKKWNNALLFPRGGQFSLNGTEIQLTVVHNVFRFLTFYNMINQRHGLKIVGKGIIRWGEGPVFRRSQLLSAEENERIACGQ